MTSFYTLYYLFYNLLFSFNVNIYIFTDPYLVLKCTGNDNVEQISTTKFDTLNPKWEPPERFDFIVCNSASSKLELQLRDEDNLLLTTGRSLAGQSTAKLLGKASIDVAEIACNLDPIDKTFELKEGQGRLSVRFWWYSTGDAIRLS